MPTLKQQFIFDCVRILLFIGVIILFVFFANQVNLAKDLNSCEICDKKSDLKCYNFTIADSPDKNFTNKHVEEDLSKNKFNISEVEIRS